MNPFLAQILQRCEIFSPYKTQCLTIDSPFFSKPNKSVEHFIAEIQQTAELLTGVQDENYINAIAERVFHQFEALHNALKSHNATKKNTLPEYHSNYHFPRNIHHLAPTKRLAEYRKALRALNEKISWLTEQSYAYPQWQQRLQQLILETEYRKEKCLNAIDQLEAEMGFQR